MKRFVLGAAVGLAVGLVMARAMSSPSAPPQQEAAANAPAAAPGIGADDLAALGAELRAELRAGRLPEDEPAAAAVPTPPDKAAPSPEAANASAAATDLIERAIGVGRWTESDAEQLRTLLPQLPPDDVDQVLSALTTAINEQALVPASPRLL